MSPEGHAVIRTFYLGVWQTVTSLMGPEGTDHYDLNLTYLLEVSPEGATEGGLLRYFEMADEGGVVSETVFTDEHGHRILRVIDCQAGPSFVISDDRLQELTEAL